MPKSAEGKAAEKIGNILNQRGLNNNLVAYFLHQNLTTEVQAEVFDLFMHFVKQINQNPPAHISMDTANMLMITDEIERAVRNAGYEFK